MKNDKIGHNNPSLNLQDFIIKDKAEKTTGRTTFKLIYIYAE
jgi:hypothetical protein